MLSKLKVFLELSLFYIYDLILCSLRVALDVMTPEQQSEPGIFEYNTSAESDTEYTLIANLITFSPGNMVVDINYEKKILFIHTMFLDEKKQTKDFIKEKIESKLLNLMRGGK